MKIIVTVRTRNEAERIERFIMSYQWADKILIADGGSEDNTLTLCQGLPKTEVRKFLDRVPSDDGEVWRNPHGRHINFLIDWAEEEGADWIIFDDCDCIPNYALKAEGRSILEKSSDYVMVNRVYFYKEESYFEELTKPTKDWTPSLWAWRANKDIRAKEESGWEHYIDIHLEGLRRGDIKPPFCLLHYFYPDDEFMQSKMDFYEHMRPTIRDPKDYGGKLLPLEEWMRE